MPSGKAIHKWSMPPIVHALASYWAAVPCSSTNEPSTVNKPHLICSKTEPNTSEKSQCLLQKTLLQSNVRHKHKSKWQIVRQSWLEPEQEILQCSQMKFMYKLISSDPRWVCLAELEEWPLLVMYLLNIREIRLRKDSVRWKLVNVLQASSHLLCHLSRNESFLIFHW